MHLGTGRCLNRYLYSIFSLLCQLHAFQAAQHVIPSLIAVLRRYPDLLYRCSLLYLANLHLRTYLHLVSVMLEISKQQDQIFLACVRIILSSPKLFQMIDVSDDGLSTCKCGRAAPTYQFRVLAPITHWATAMNLGRTACC